jgi:LmbE family N-acetylglucosaminyl deacetylase
LSTPRHISLTTEGNNYGLGVKRKEELQGSCAALGIDAGRCLALDQAQLQDSPKVWWDEDIITRTVKKYVKKWNVDLVSLAATVRRIRVTNWTSDNYF